METMPGMLDLAAAGAIDLGAAADITSNIMSGFSMEASEAGKVSDILALAASSSNTDIHGLGESMKMVAPVASNLGVSIEDTSAAIGILGDNGIAGSQAGNMLKRGLLNLASPSDKAAKLMGELGMEMFDANGQMKSMPDVIGELENGLEGMTDQQKTATLETIFGSEAVSGWSALINAGSDDLAKFSGELENSSGSAAKMAETMNDNAKGGLKELQSAFEDLMITVSDKLTPVFTEIVEKVTEVVRWFGDLGDGTQTAIIAFGAVVTAIGPLLMIAGTLISSIGSIISVFSAVSGVVASAGGAVALFTNPIGWVIAAVGALIAIGIALWKNWDTIGEKFGVVGQVLAAVATGPVGMIIGGIKLFQEATSDAIPEVERFSDEVSESTQKAVGAFMDMSEEADMALKEIAWSQQEMNEEMAQNMIEGQQVITDSLLSAIDERHNAELEAAQAQFEQLEGLNEEQKASILEKLDERFNEEAQITEEGNERIAEIINAASEEKRALTQDESDEILAIRQDMTEQAVAVMSENEAEQKVIYEKMKDNASAISAQEAIEVANNSKKKKDDVIKEADEQYDETYKWAIRQRDELGTMSAEEAQAVIDEAKNKRDKTVENAEDMHKKVVAEAKKQAEGLVKETEDGTLKSLTKWEVFKKDISSKAKEIGSNTKKAFKDLWDNTKRYFSGLWDDTKSHFSNIASTISSKVEEAKTAASNKISELKSNFVGRFGEIVSEASNKFNETKNKITKPIEDARDAIGRAIDTVKRFFSGLSLRFPDIKPPKLPRFTLNGKFSLSPPSVPRVGIQWFAKGGIMKKPTAFGMNGNNLMVGGEAGAEAILPLNKSTLGGIGKGIAATMDVPQGKQQPTKVENNEEHNYHFEFKVDKMTGDEGDIKKFTKIITDNLKRRKGGRR